MLSSSSCSQDPILLLASLPANPNVVVDSGRDTTLEKNIIVLLHVPLEVIDVNTCNGLTFHPLK